MLSYLVREVTFTRQEMEAMVLTELRNQCFNPDVKSLRLRLNNIAGEAYVKWDEPQLKKVKK